MKLSLLKNTILLFVLAAFSCGNGPKASNKANTQAEVVVEFQLGADRTEAYLPLLNGKTIGVVANQTARLSTKDIHLVDHLLEQGISIQSVFAPEHGFRGKADAGELVKDGIDTKTGLPIVSLYGKNKKPSPEMLAGIDLIVFDIQDVGARFYTYISTLHYVMEAAAEQGIAVMVLDRPNPNGHYIDGPILEPEHKSFVGMHPIPVVHGMTIGEYAQMINGEAWLEAGAKCSLSVIQMEGYHRDMPYSLPIKPSPNLPNDVAINLYPSLCFFEGTPVSAGRGTDKQFQIFGSPELPKERFPFGFTPGPNEGAKYPKFSGKACQGMDLSGHERISRINLHWLIEAYAEYEGQEFFTPFFTKLAGTSTLQKQIENGLSPEQIRESWQPGLKAFEQMRQPYLMYN